MSIKCLMKLTTGPKTWLGPSNMSLARYHPAMAAVNRKVLTKIDNI
jgi:hypothetical protein